MRDGLDAVLGPGAAPLVARIEEGWQSIRDRWRPEVDVDVPGGASVSIYRAYSLLFAPAFPAIPTDALVAIGLAARLLATSSFCTDAVIDDPLRAVERADTLVRATALTFEADRILHGLFPPTARLWQRKRDLLRRTASAILDEFPPDDDRPLAVASERGALARAADRSALAMIVPFALAELAGDDAPLDRLIPSIEHYYRGRQMMDDLQDWRADARAGRPTYPLALAARRLGNPDASLLDAPARDVLASVADEIRAIADRELMVARSLAEGGGARPWARAIEVVRRSYRRDLDGEPAVAEPAPR